MRRFGRKNSVAGDEEGGPPHTDGSSPVRSPRSSNSPSSRGGEHSPSLFRPGARAGEGEGVGGGAVVAVSNRKMLKIGANVRFRGDVMECNTVVLCGRLQGFVETRRLSIKEGARFVGDAKVEVADVSGSLEGSLECTDKISIRSTGHVSGNVIYKKMSMEDGGELEGTFECSNRASGRQRRKGAAAMAFGAAVERSATGMSSFLAGGQDPQSTTPPREQSPIPWEQEGASEEAGVGAGAERTDAGAGAGGGHARAGAGAGVSSSSSLSSPLQLSRLLQPQQIGAAVPAGSASASSLSASSVWDLAGSESLFAYSNKDASLKPPSSAAATSSSPAPGSSSSAAATVLAAPEPGSIVRAAMPSTAGGAFRKIGAGAGPSAVGGGGGSPAVLPPALSRTVAPPAPKRPGGLHVVSPGKEAAEMFSAEAVTPTGQSGAELSGKFPLPGEAAAAAGGGNTAEADGGSGGGGGTSVASRVGTWPPASPLPAARSWARRTEAVAPSPASRILPAQTPSHLSPTLTPNTGARKTLAVESNSNNNNSSSNSSSDVPPASHAAVVGGPAVEPRPQEGVSASRRGSGSGSGGSGGVVAGMAGGGGGYLGSSLGTAGRRDSGGIESAPAQQAEEGVEEEEEEDDAPRETSGPVKACQASGCTLEACWGDPRFRPRYCARHKKQGNKLMDPVEQEEGEEAASPEGASPPLSPPQESSPSSRQRPSAAGLRQSPTQPKPVASGGKGVSNGSRIGAGGSGAGVEVAVAVASARASAKTSGSEDDEDEDEGWDTGTAVAGAIAGRLVGGVPSANGGGSTLRGTGGGGGGGGGGGIGIGFGAQSALPVVQAELVGNGPGNDDPRQHLPDYDPAADNGGYGGGVGGGGAIDPDEEDADDVQTKVSAYGRLAGKKGSPSLSLHKSRATSQRKKRPSGNNIADFYGGGDSDEDDAETAFSMEAYSKGVLLSQAAEVGTHTEDGQLRPQASQERDQQKLAHLMKVGKLGGRISALRGKGVSTAGKRR